MIGKQMMKKERSQQELSSMNNTNVEQSYGTYKPCETEPSLFGTSTSRLKL